MYGPFASQPTKNDPAPSTTVNRDTECYATLILTVVVLRTVTEFHVTLSIATDVPLSFHVTLR